MDTTVQQYDLSKLSQREKQVFGLILKGASTVQIGERLGVSGKTIETHRARIHKKLGTRSSFDIVRLGILANAITVADLQ